MISGAHKLAAPAITEIIEEARDAEICRNIAMMREALAPVWPDINLDPDYAGFGNLIEARLLRLSGFLLSFIGKSCNRPDYHPRAKDLLSAAVNLFGTEGALDEEAEANVILAVAYKYNGEIEEFDAILDTLETVLPERLEHPVRIQIQLNRLTSDYYKADHHIAARLIEEMATPVRVCGDLRLQMMYFNQAGLILSAIGQHDEAASRMREAMERSLNADNQRFHGLNLNNLASIYCGAERFEEAEDYARRSISLFTSLGDTGWIPHVLDTKALIMLDSGRAAEALVVIDEAIELFRLGADHMGLCDAKWTRARVLLRLGRTEDAFQCYARLHAIAAANIGSTATTKYTRLLIDELTISRSETTAADIARLEDICGSDEVPIDLFFVSRRIMSTFSVDEDCAVPVRAFQQPSKDLPVIYCAEAELCLGRVGFDTFSQMYYIAHDPAFPTPLEQMPVIGEVLGYCSIDDVEGGRTQFFDFPRA